MGAPFERLIIDIVGPLPTTVRGNKQIVVVMDSFTKWPEAYPVEDIRAETVARGLFEHVISRFGVPKEIHSDQGTSFEAAVFQEVMSLLGVHKTRATPMHPQSGGQVERFNRTLWNMLSKVTEKNQKDWDLKLPGVLMAYRGTEHSATGFSPAFLMLGRELALPVHLLTGGTPRRAPSTVYAQELQTLLMEAHDLARTRLLQAAEASK